MDSVIGKLKSEVDLISEELALLWIYKDVPEIADAKALKEIDTKKSRKELKQGTMVTAKERALNNMLIKIRPEILAINKRPTQDEQDKRLIIVFEKIVELEKRREIIISDIINVYESKGIERLKNLAGLVVKTLEDTYTIFKHEVPLDDIIIEGKKALLVDLRKEVAYATTGRLDYSHKEIICKFFSLVDSLIKDIKATVEFYSPSDLTDTNLHLPNISNRLALLNQLGIIEHLKTKFPKALDNQPAHMIAVLALILDIPNNKKAGFGATVKNLLNKTNKTPETKTALGKIKVQLAEIGIQI